MMCPDAQMQYEDMFLAALGFTRNIHIDGDRLILEWMSIDGGEWGDMVFRVDTQPDGQE